MSTPQKARFLDRTTPPHIATLILVTGLSAMSMNMFLPSLPGMAEYFRTDYRVMQLSVAVYLAMSAVLQIVIGPVSDRYGRRPVLLASFALFLLATLGCLLSTSAEVFLAFRLAQAVVVTAQVLSRASIRDVYTQEQSASMIGYVTMGMAAVPMVAPAIGGLLDQAFGWQGTFTLLLVAGLAVMALAWADMGETRLRSQSSLAAQFREYPGLLRSRRFWGYCLTAALSSGAFFAFLGGAPYVGSEVYGLDPATLGLCFAAPAMGYASGNFLTGRYSMRVGTNRMIVWGTGITTLGMGLSLALTHAGLSGPWVFFGLMTTVGIGNGMSMPNATSGMLSARPHLAGTASGLGGAIMIGGGAGLSALAGALLVPGSGEAPLLWIMFLTSAASMLTIRWVIRRARALGLT